MPSIVTRLVTAAESQGGLGYCCEWMFFHHNGRTSLIADRLCLTSRTIRLRKALFRAGAFRCEKKDCCLKPRLG